MWSKEEIEGKKKQIEGAINLKAAEFINDPQLAAVGEAQLLAGEAQQDIGQVRREAGEAAAKSDEVIAGLQQSIQERRQFLAQHQETAPATTEREAIMLRSVNDLSGFKIVARDGGIEDVEIGYVEEFYFDDERWTVRYMVVNTGNWLAGRQVLVSPFAVSQVDWVKRQLHVTLTKSQVENSPSIDTHKPVSRQMEAAHASYYGYPYYWDSPMLWGTAESPEMAVQQSYGAAASAAPSAATTERLTNTVTVDDIAPDVHLRSTQEVSTYSMAATDGDLGQVADFIVEDLSWAIRYLAVDTRKWLPGKKVMISPQWITSIDWAQAKVHVNLTREGVKQSPEYDSSKLLSREYEAQLYEHYGQTGYWLN